MKNSILLLIITIFCSCSRLVAPPDKRHSEILKISDKSVSEQQALILYNLENGTVDCSKLSSLATSKKNPLNQWIKIQYIANCNTSQGKLQSLFDSRDDLKEWVKQDLYNLVIKKSDNIDSKVEAYSLLTKYLKTQDEKVRNIKAAIGLAKKSNRSLSKLKSMLIDISPLYNQDINASNIFTIAKDFHRNRKFKKARTLYKKIIKSQTTSLKEKVLAWDKLRFSYKLDRDIESYRKETRKLVLFLRSIKNDDYAREMNAKFSNILARIYWTKGNLTRAKRVIRDVLILKEIPLKHKINSYYHLAGIHADRRQHSRAVHYYKKAYQTIEDDHEHKEAILWNVGWHYYKRKKYQQAINWFNNYIPKEGESPQFRFTYWKAISYKKLGNKDKFKEVMSSLRSQDPYGFYGQMAHVDSVALQPINSDTKSHEFKADALSWSIYLNNFDLAHKIVDHTKDIDLLEFYHAEYFDKLIFKYFSFDYEKRKEILKESPLYAYPLAYKADFIKSNLSKNVPTELLMAIARQESAFNKYARSPADAFGLLQLIPIRAKELSKRYKIPFKNYNDLYSPETNIALSSKLLDQLMRRQKKNFIHFVASYNAGETPINRWKKSFKKLSDMEFIEEIPYSETRKYVKLVARNILVYKRLLSDKEFHITKNFFRGGYK